MAAGAWDTALGRCRCVWAGLRAGPVILGRMRRPGSGTVTFLFGLLVLAASLGAEAPEPGSPGGEGVRVTYLANEGFLLESGETRVLIDALFGNGLTEYPAVPEDLRADLEGARGRFAGVQLILASHSHADHFDAAAVARHLRANPEAAFLSTREAAAALREEMGAAAAGREIFGVYPETGGRESHHIGEVDLQVLNLSHGPLPIENLGLIAQLGGMAVLHVGDTSAEAPELSAYAQPLAGVDVWLLPDWLMGETDWEAARSRAAGPTWLVDMHLAAPTAPSAWFGSAGTHAARIARVREALPDTWIPVEALASRRYPPPTP